MEFQLKKADYEIAKTYQSIFKSHLIGHIGYNLSFGGKWFGGFRSDNTGKRDYVAEAYRGAIKQHNNLICLYLVKMVTIIKLINISSLRIFIIFY